MLASRAVSFRSPYGPKTSHTLLTGNDALENTGGKMSNEKFAVLASTGLQREFIEHIYRCK